MPDGCSSQTGGSYTAHYKASGVTCPGYDDLYQKVCSSTKWAVYSFESGTTPGGAYYNGDNGNNVWTLKSGTTPSGSTGPAGGANGEDDDVVGLDYLILVAAFNFAAARKRWLDSQPVAADSRVKRRD